MHMPVLAGFVFESQMKDIEELKYEQIDPNVDDLDDSLSEDSVSSDEE